MYYLCRNINFSYVEILLLPYINYIDFRIRRFALSTAIVSNDVR